MKKVITLCLCLMLIVSCMAPAALADDPVIQVSGGTAIDGDYNSVAEYFTAYFAAAMQSTLKGPMTVTLLDDVTISGNTPIMLSNTDHESPSILDLNGHTITVSGSVGILAGATSGCPIIIKNGTIDVEASSGTDGGAIVLQDGYTTISNVHITSDEGVSGAIGINFINNSASQANIENSIIDVGSQNSDVEIESNGSLTITSGHFGNLNTSPSGKIQLANGSSALTENPDGVTGTVITSTATTAMIVKGGNVYLYDTLQDAVDAVDAYDTIQLLKQPTEGKVTVPDDPQFSISAFGEGVNTSDLQLVTQDGKKVTVGESGEVEVVDIPAESITLDKTSVEVFKGKTVTLTATVSPANTTDTITWSSNDSSVATVNENGVVTGVSQGTAIITAQAGDKTALCTVTVDPTWIVKLDGVEYKVIKGQPFTFPSAPTKPGYIFMGWRGADGATYQPGDEVAITGNTSFKAIWANMPDITPGTPDEPDDEPDVDVFPFYDVSSGAWYYDAVKYVWEHELMNGVSATEFSPNTTLNRAMIWTMLARLDGVNTDGGASWYAKAQEWAMAEGVSDGTDPMGAVTREQLVTMLWRFKGEPTVDFLLTAKDADTVSSWAYEAMRWAVAEGIIEGDENGLVTPTATATRAQAAAIFMRFIEG